MSGSTLPLLGAGLLLAAAGGLELGQSTIGLIKPIHFQGPVLHPRDRGAALDPVPVEPKQASFASYYGWEEGRSARFEDCGDCEAIHARDAFAGFDDGPVIVERAVARTLAERDIHPSFESDEGVHPDDHWNDPQATRPTLEARVVRYAYYEIEAEPLEDPADFDLVE